MQLAGRKGYRTHDPSGISPRVDLPTLMVFIQYDNGDIGNQNSLYLTFNIRRA